MRITSLSLKDIRGFSYVEKIAFSKEINILIGANNSGKSTVLKIFQLLQLQAVPQGEVSWVDLITLGKNDASVTLGIDDPNFKVFKKPTHMQVGVSFNYSSGAIKLDLNRATRRYTWHDSHGEYGQFEFFSIIEPNNIIYPYLSKRKVANYSEVINENAARTITGDLSNLYAKIDKVSNPSLPSYNEYIEACKEIFGSEFIISSIASVNGKKSVFAVNNFDNIPLDKMGEGVSSLLGLIVDLCIAENKIFLIEELENDIHPKALKGILKLIEKKSRENQFFISTHSNIVVKYLGANTATKIFETSVTFKDKLPISSIVEVGTSEQRIDALEELGYESSDYGLWKAWLFLEESSAEEIIREYLIPWFASSLKQKLRTFVSIRPSTS